MADLNIESMLEYLEAQGVTVPAAKKRKPDELKQLIILYHEEEGMKPAFACGDCGNKLPDAIEDRCPFCGAYFEDDGEEEVSDNGASEDTVQPEPEPEEAPAAQPAKSSKKLKSSKTLKKPEAEKPEETETGKGQKKVKKQKTVKKDTQKKTPAKKKAAQKPAPAEQTEQTTVKPAPSQKPASNKVAKKAPTKKPVPKTRKAAKAEAASKRVTLPQKVEEFNGKIIDGSGKVSLDTFRVGVEALHRSFSDQKMQQSFLRLKRLARYAQIISDDLCTAKLGKKQVKGIMANSMLAHEATSVRNEKRCHSARVCLLGGANRYSAAYENANTDALWQCAELVEKALRAKKEVMREKLAEKALAVYGWKPEAPTSMQRFKTKTNPAPAQKKTSKKAPAQKAPAKKAPAKKAPAKKKVAKKTSGKKTVKK